MSPGSTRFSYRDRKSTKKQRLRILFWLLAMFILFSFFTEMILNSASIGSVAMEPSTVIGDSYFYHPIQSTQNIQRGDVVLLYPPYYKKNSTFVSFTNIFLRIISFQNLEITSWERKSWEKPLLVKRVIALPGDSIYMEDYVFYIKTAGNEYYLSEFETSEALYDIFTPLNTDNSESLLAGNLEEKVLNPGEFFVMGDNRNQSSDSSTWGIISMNKIYGKLLFCYWPIKHAGKI